MSIKDVYHPGRAIDDPEVYYDNAFHNRPKPWVVSMVGHAAVAWARPTITFQGTDDETEYWSEIGNDQKVLSFSHFGEKKYHDTSAAAAVLFESEYLLRNLSDLRVWAAVPYMTHRGIGPIVQGLGGIPVIRSGDYKYYKVEPSTEESEEVTDTLISKSAKHLEIPDSTLAIFPAGTKGTSKIREGIGLLLELVDATVIPIVMISDSLDKNRPKNLRAMYGEPIKTQPDMVANDYVKRIGESIGVAADIIR